MITLDKIEDLPKNTLYREFDVEIPEGTAADFLFITPTLKIHKYFITIKVIKRSESDDILY